MNSARFASTLLCLLFGFTTQIRAAEVIAVADDTGLRQALQNAKPDTVIRIAAGKYRGDLWVEGLRGVAGKPIVLRAADPHNRPIITGGATGLHLVAPAYVELHDLIITDFSQNGINIDDGGNRDVPASHIVLRGLDVRKIGPTGNCDGVKLSGLADFRVENCAVEQWGDGGQGIDMVGCRRGEVIGCTLRHTEGTNTVGVQTKGGSSDISIRGCRFEHIGQRGVNIGGSTGLPYFRPQPQGYEAKAITVEDCAFIGGAAAIAFVGADGATVRHNTIYRPRRYAFRILQETTGLDFVPCRNGQFTDNLIVYRAKELVLPVNVGTGTRPDSFVLARNAWYCEDAPDSSQPQLPIPEQAGTYGTDPEFQNADEGNLRLKASSGIQSAGSRSAISLSPQATR